MLRFRLEAVCHAGTAVTPLVALSAEVLMALQRLERRMPGPKVVRLEKWRSAHIG